MPHSIKLLAVLLLATGLTSHAQVVEEREIERNGMYTVCGNAEGMQPCRDRNGMTYEEEMHGPDIQAESSDELAAQAERIRNESPEELEETIKEMEQDHEPDGY
ncbi:MAG: hypothetical protein V2I66_18145 [Halieaceae bacterium]|jgi:hypothetical protein|nr:hypothetical protein [Halieaceae bacterium]